MYRGRRLARVLLRNMFALGHCLAEDSRIKRLACGPDMIWITARTALSGKLSLVMTFVVHLVARSATPLPGPPRVRDTLGACDQQETR
jgi:hypothetical protein